MSKSEILTMKEIEGLMETAGKELLASPLKKRFQGDDDPSEFDPRDFLYQVWTTFKDEEVWEASPTLKRALVAFVRYFAEDALRSFDEIIGNENGQNQIVVADVREFDNRCWEVWRSMKL